MEYNPHQEPMTAKIEPSTVKTKHRTRPADYLRTAGVMVPAHATGVNVSRRYLEMGLS